MQTMKGQLASFRFLTLLAGRQPCLLLCGEFPAFPNLGEDTPEGARRKKSYATIIRHHAPYMQALDRSVLRPSHLCIRNRGSVHTRRGNMAQVPRGKFQGTQHTLQRGGRPVRILYPNRVRKILGVWRGGGGGGCWGGGFGRAPGGVPGGGGGSQGV